MAKNEAPKTDEELRARIQAEVDSAIGFDDEMQAERDMAIRYYHAEPLGNEIDGRSNFVDSTVQDSIEWIMPSLMRG